MVAKFKLDNTPAQACHTKMPAKALNRPILVQINVHQSLSSSNRVYQHRGGYSGPAVPAFHKIRSLHNHPSSKQLMSVEPLAVISQLVRPRSTQKKPINPLDPCSLHACKKQDGVPGNDTYSSCHMPRVRFPGAPSSSDIIRHFFTLFRQIPFFEFLGKRPSIAETYFFFLLSPFSFLLEQQRRFTKTGHAFVYVRNLMDAFWPSVCERQGKDNRTLSDPKLKEPIVGGSPFLESFRL